ncbi:S-adenosyl-L-methionine-dependent methyltransferase [Hygrophoropsis aurantiaca]|uniref:S-adenosyl-L-methionine-dependent methyltransferase n=1 Tax=Hygrophoropsis aurantiaca TaxID=72124 RepID=A0ACB8AJU5_9AGAM|nr:S-adenosyl-L-methionine-dependent methyltransferase [Hygrophoropsis aurantiaca]
MLRLAPKPPFNKVLRLGGAQCLTRCRPPKIRHVQNRTYSVNNRINATEVERILIDSIKAAGPISFSTYMQLCLAHPTHGYYMKPEHEVFGARGDFITSPEVSQVFGELMAVWMLERWMKDAQSKPFRIVELGPGRGTLMADMLRVISQFPSLREKLAGVHLVETSESMRSMQKKTLHTAIPSGQIMWHDAVEDIPLNDGKYTMLAAHEFFDALPVHVLERTQQGWHEVLIALAQDDSASSPPSSPPGNISNNSDITPRWRLVLSPSPTASSTILGLASPRFKTAEVGTRIEVSAASMRTARRIGDLLASDGGCALVVDYGGDHTFGNSIRAFKDHKIVDIFDLPGECDITANVDFALLKEVLGKNVTTYGSIPQGDFLTRLGLRLRVEALKRAASSDLRKDAIETGAQRLVDPLGMGGQYRVMGVTSRIEGDKDREVWPFVDIAAQADTDCINVQS